MSGEREVPRAYYDEHMVDPDTGNDCVEPNVVVVTEGGNHYFEMATDRAGRALAEKLTGIFEGLRAERDAALECLSLTTGKLEALKATPPTDEGQNICGHNRYWVGHYGKCMACLLAKAESERDAALLRIEDLGWVVAGLREELERAKAERNTEHVKTNRALLRVGEAEGMLREAMPWLGEWARAEGITERIEGFLGGAGERP